MINYEPKSLPYTKFVRSNAPAQFQEFDKPEVAICWIDLLGVRDFNHQQIIIAVESALNSAVEGSCSGPIFDNGVLIGNANSATQFCIVGDALLIVEKDQPGVQAAAKLSFFYRVNIISRLLNEKGHIHRGVITSGPVKCFKFEGSSLITGLGVLKAASLEKNLKIAGLFYDDSFAKFMSARGVQMTKQSVYIPFSTVPDFDFQKHAPKLCGACFTQFEGLEFWKKIISTGDQSFDKVINAKDLLSKIKNAHKLP